MRVDFGAIIPLSVTLRLKHFNVCPADKWLRYGDCPRVYIDIEVIRFWGVTLYRKEAP
jgi:hypothetical protein